MTDIFQKAELIDIDKIDIKASPMVRACDSDSTIKEMWNLLIDGAKYPAVDLFWIEDLNSYILADGRHRFFAHQLNNEEQILAVVHRGGERKALEFALKANANHGLPLNDADVRCSLKIILEDTEWSKLSNRAIGKMIGRSEITVRRFRKAQEPDINCDNVALDEKPADTAEKTASPATPRAKQEPTKRVGIDGKERKLPTPKPPAEGKETISPELRREAKANFGTFVRGINKVPAWKALLEPELTAIAEKMKANWGRGGK